MNSKGAVPAMRRFLVFGLVNNALSHTIFIMLGLVIAPRTAHVVGYLAGIAFVSTLSNRMVFRGPQSPAKNVGYGIWYLFVLLLGQSVVWILAPEGFWELAITAGALIALTVPLNVLVGMAIFRSRPGMKSVVSTRNATT